MLLLDNQIQPYAWGPVDGLVPLVGSAPTGGPEAELWVGTHPAAPSRLAGDPGGRTLAELIADDPRRWLGPELAAAGHTALPFLLKVLAIGSPLSLQAHPSADDAARGFAREEEAGIPVDAPERTYRDPSPKPEALVALTETWALCGFREPAVAAAIVDGLGEPALAPLAERLRGEGALASALAWILRLRDPERTEVAAAAARTAPDPGEAEPLATARRWIARLARAYPGDPAAVAPALLEVVRLDPGGAVHLPAGNLHAYLTGAGIEIMAASDNVLRGGLTPKHVDVDELLRVLCFAPGVPARPARRTDGALTRYDAGEAAFALATVEPGAGPTELDHHGPALLLATGGPVDVAGPAGGLVLDHGDGAFVPAGEGPVTVSGRGRLWCATVGELPG